MALNANSVLLRSQVRGGRSTLRFNGTSANVMTVANSTVNADISSTNDSITGASISGMVFSFTGNTVVVQRANSTVTVNVATLSGTGTWTAAQGWLGDGQLPSQNVVVTYNTGALGTLYMEFAKQYAGGGGNVLE